MVYSVCVVCIGRTQRVLYVCMYDCMYGLIQVQTSVNLIAAYTLFTIAHVVNYLCASTLYVLQS